MSEFDYKHDPDDVELKSLMGDKFQVGKFRDNGKKPIDCSGTVGKFSQPRSRAVADDYPTPSEDITENESVAEDATHKSMTNSKVFSAKLSECAKSSLAFGGLNLLLFYWEHTGLMAESIAVPSMCVCAVLFGFGIGKAFRREK